VSTDPVDAQAIHGLPPPPPDDAPVDVHLVRYPLRLGQRATEHYEEVFREFALMAGDGPGHSEGVPARLLALVDALGRRYAPQQEHEMAREEALARGEREHDFTITVPASAAAASEVLGAMLDETDDFCRAGTLLTLAAPDDVVAFRRWYLRQVIDQVAGQPPQPWPGGLD
jgi:hypothetical protein